MGLLKKLKKSQKAETNKEDEKKGPQSKKVFSLKAADVEPKYIKSEDELLRAILYFGMVLAKHAQEEGTEAAANAFSEIVIFLVHEYLGLVLTGEMVPFVIKGIEDEATFAKAFKNFMAEGNTLLAKNGVQFKETDNGGLEIDMDELRKKAKAEGAL